MMGLWELIVDLLVLFGWGYLAWCCLQAVFKEKK